MKLRLPLNRALGASLVALAAGLTREAAEQLASLAPGPVEPVHRARVALKRARSTLRLLEKAGADWALVPRYRLAHLAGLMSAARETAVVAALASKLAQQLAEGPPREVALLLAAKRGRLVPPEVDLIRAALRQEAQQLAQAPVPVITPLQLRHLLRRSLVRADRQYRDAALLATLDSFHSWRKAVIVLRDQCALAAARWPSGAGGAHPLLFKLARQLGHGGDLALLGQRLERLRVPPGCDSARRELIRRLQAERQLAIAQALRRWPRLEKQLAYFLSERDPYFATPADHPR
ncbi:MAG: CHAD domain-containing protein [Opitutae bacterium]